MSPHKPSLALAIAALALLLPARGSSQAASRDTTLRIEVRGRVVDAVSGAPIEGAVVELSDARRKAAADATGAFVLRAVTPGTHHWVISRLGYAAWEEDSEVEDGEELTIRLLPRPQVLEGITAVASRLMLRREASGFMSRVINRNTIKLSAAPDVAVLVRNQLGLAGVPCPSRSGAEGEPRCAWVRGELVAVAVYLDEQRLAGGLADLSYYLPQEVYTIESFYGGAMVRVITDTFAARLARGQVSLLPLQY
jgi:hypothetical protein